MTRPPLNHMMQHEDTLADEFDAILGYRATHAGLVLDAYIPLLVDTNNNSGLRINGTLTSAMSASTTGTFSGWFAFQDTVANEVIFQLVVDGSPAMSLVRTADGGLALNDWGTHYDADLETTYTQRSGAPLTTPPISNGYLHHIFVTLDSDAGASIYVDGQLYAYAAAGFPGMSIDWNLVNGVGVFMLYTGSAARVDCYAADLMFFAGHLGDVADFHNNGAPPNPGATGSGVDGTTPTFFLGGAMTAAQWNTTTWQGLGSGTVTRPGDFTVGAAGTYVAPVTVTLSPTLERLYLVNLGAGGTFTDGVVTTPSGTAQTKIYFTGAAPPTGAWDRAELLMGFALPDAAIIHSASLNIHSEASTGNNRLSAWFQWTPANTTLPTDHVSFSPAGTDDIEWDAAGVRETVDLTDAVSWMIRGYNQFATPASDTSRYGHGDILMHLEQDEFNLNGTNTIRLSDHVTAASRPALTVTYTPS